MVEGAVNRLRALFWSVLTLLGVAVSLVWLGFFVFGVEAGARAVCG